MGGKVETTDARKGYYTLRWCTIIGEKQKDSDHNHLLMNQANQVPEFWVVDLKLDKAVSALRQISNLFFVSKAIH